MTTLTPELRRALEDAGGVPVAIVDPQTNERYVLIRADAYDRLQILFEQAALSKEEQRFLLQEAGKRAGWDDPEMDIYNDLDPRL